jgi:uncharacterized protein (TIGR03435 family)
MSKRVFATITAGLALAASTLFAQTQPPAFEVATIKPAQLPAPAQIAAGKMHIGMNVDGARVDIGALSLADLIRIAYRVKSYQVSGPEWMATQRFDVMGKIPDGVSKDLVPEMLQALLVERFKLEFHRDTKDHAVYALVVGKGGPKLKESPPDEETPAKEDGGVSIGTEKGPVRMTTDSKGVVVRSAATGTTRMTMGANGMMRMEASKLTMEGMAEMLSRFVDKPVVDMTELKGNYQVALDISMEDLKKVARSAGVNIPGPDGEAGKAPAEAASDPSGGSIFESVQQLGLKLESRKAPMETLVIDHVEKTPTEN